MPFRATQNPCVLGVTLDKLLAALSAIPVAAVLAGAKVHLYTNPITPNPNSVATDFTEATFAGYAVAALPALSAEINPDSNNRGVTAEIVFIGGAVVSPGEVIYGYYITDTAGTVLWIAERFATPVNIASPGDFCGIQFVFPEPFQRPVAE